MIEVVGRQVGYKNNRDDKKPILGEDGNYGFEDHYGGVLDIVRHYKSVNKSSTSKEELLQQEEELRSYQCDI